MWSRLFGKVVYKGLVWRVIETVSLNKNFHYLYVLLQFFQRTLGLGGGGSWISLPCRGIFENWWRDNVWATILLLLSIKKVRIIALTWGYTMCETVYQIELHWIILWMILALESFIWSWTFLQLSLLHSFLLKYHIYMLNHMLYPWEKRQVRLFHC